MKSRSEDNKPNPKFYYSGHHIVKIWEQYLKNGENGIKFLVYDTNEELKDEESIFIDLSQQKEVALVLNNRSSLYKNSSNQSITLCGEIDHDSKGVENIEFALNQIKKYNQDNELKVNDHIIIFPYHVTSNHWNLGVISLNVNNDKEFNNATLSVYEPFGGSLANLTLLNYISSNTQLKDISPVKSENHIKQQSDSSACGAITAENGKDFLNKEKKSSYLSKIYTKGAKDLRKAHMDEIGSEDFNMEQNKNKNYNAKGDLDIEEKDSIIEIICKITQIDDWIKPLLFRYEEITSNSRATESENNAAKELLDVLKNFLKNIQSNLPHPIINDKGEFVDGGGNLITDLVKNMKSKNTISIGQEDLITSPLRENMSFPAKKPITDINKPKITDSAGPKFVVNPIIYVDGEESDNSSDLDYTSSDEKVFNSIANIITKDNLPFKTFKVTKSKAKKTKDQNKFSKPVGFIGNNSTPIEDKGDYKSTVAQGFLDELYKSGLESSSQDKIEEVVSVSMLLNRPLSISTRKNHLLTRELEAPTKSQINHKKAGIFWEFQWYDATNNKVEYPIVKTFYKKLKKYDKKHGTNKAQQFQNIAEKGIAVPYQDLREHAKNHKNTQELIKSARKVSSENELYMSFVDGDTKSFNGIYSAYIRIYQNSKISPTVMSTGYEFQLERVGDHPLLEGCKVDRQIRVATAKHLPWSIYYPEPNFCVLVLPGTEFLEESFIDKSIKLNGVIIKNAESVALIRHLLEKRGETITAVFIDDNPLITTIPTRVRCIKGAKKTQIKFSEEFKAGYAPTDKDFTLFKQMSQSHVHEGVWIDNLYINRGIKIQSRKHFKFKGLVTKYLKPAHTSEEKKELLTIISDKDLKLVKDAYEAKEEFIKEYTKNLRTTGMEDLYIYIRDDLKNEIGNFNGDFLKIVGVADVLRLIKEGTINLDDLNKFPSDILRDILYNSEVLELIEEDTINLDDLNKFPSDILRNILYNSEVLELIKEGTINLQVLVNLNARTQERNEEFSEILVEFISAEKNYSEHSLTPNEIVELYYESRLHLSILTNMHDLDSYVLENSDDSGLVSLVVDHYVDYVDLEWIREELRGDGDLDSASLMYFDSLIGTYDDDSTEEDSPEEDSPYMDNMNNDQGESGLDARANNRMEEDKEASLIGDIGNTDH